MTRFRPIVCLLFAFALLLSAAARSADDPPKRKIDPAIEEFLKANPTKTQDPQKWGKITFEGDPDYARKVAGWAHDMNPEFRERMMMVDSACMCCLIIIRDPTTQKILSGTPVPIKKFPHYYFIEEDSAQVVMVPTYGLMWDMKPARDEYDQLVVKFTPTALPPPSVPIPRIKP